MAERATNRNRHKFTAAFDMISRFFPEWEKLLAAGDSSLVKRDRTSTAAL